MRIFITYCSRLKNEFFKDKNIKTTPDKLYTSPRIKNFIKRCKLEDVQWAIFSDLYGVWFPTELHKWYEKSPDNINNNELDYLTQNFDERLKNYSEIRFYYNPVRFHNIYKKLIERSHLKKKITLFSHINEIK